MKSERSSRKAIKIALVSILALVLVLSIGAMAFIKIAMDKSFPRVDRPDPKYVGRLRLGDVAAYKSASVEFKSGANVLKGRIYGTENNKGLVVISHGLGFGAEDYLAETIYFVGKGWRVFTYDNTGTHESEGRSTVGPSQSLLDLRAALAHIENDKQLADLRVFLYGHSWGAYAVGAVLNDRSNIAAVASLAGFNSPMELLQEQTDSMLGILSPITYPFLSIYQRLLFGDAARLAVADGINRVNTPVMILHGVKDEAISFSGASIIAHKSELTNPNVVCKACSAADHDGHNSLLRSDAASIYIKDKNQEYKALLTQYDGKVPEPIRAKYYEGVDRFKTSELNADLMNEINLFFEKQLR